MTIGVDEIEIRTTNFYLHVSITYAIHVVCSEGIGLRLTNMETESIVEGVFVTHSMHHVHCDAMIS